MALVLGSNIAAMQAQRRLSESTHELKQTFERLSSGLRINRASDDAAGLAISSSLHADRRVSIQGVRNFNDGLSLLNIADSAIDQLSTIVVRLSELAEQAANGVYGTTQRKALDAEAQELKEEYFRIERSTAFNGRALFSGDFGELKVQGGYGSNGGIQSGLGGAIGDGTIGASQTYGALNSSSMTTGDFNGDGIADIATGSGTDDTVSILLGVGNGSFGAATVFSVPGANGTGFETADFNNDGILDVITTVTSGIGVLLGNGDGSFRGSTSFTATGSSDLDVADFNSDGAMDVVLVNGNFEAEVLLGRGDGTFGPQTTYTIGDDSNYVVVGDFNNDGIADFATPAEGDGNINVSLGRGDGTFQAARTSSAGTSDPQNIQAADLNNDGNLDFVVQPKGAGTSIVAVFGFGNGTFGGARTYTIDSFSTATVLADFNGDGNIDIASSSSTTERIAIILGNGDGSFRASTSYATHTDPIRLLAGDFNGDGVVDLATASNTVDNVSINLGNVVNGVSPLLPFSLKTKADALQSMSLFDRKLDQLSAQKGAIGAFQSRLITGVSNLQISAENYQTAESRISDADIAQEAANLVKGRILQQSAAAILAQANSQPKVALSLLANKAK